MISVEERLKSIQSRGGINYSLDRLIEPLNVLGNPHQQLPPTIHVAGTNGKGSTISYIATALQELGLSVMVYTSPHLYSYRERFSLSVPGVNGLSLQAIPAEDFQLLFDEVFNKLSLFNITEFELLTLMMFVWASRIKPDFLLLETGLGGRLDATNVVSPVLSVITKIGLDHQEYLGDSLISIASEKAGIIKFKIPIITTSKQEVSVLSTFRSVASECSSELIIAPPETCKGPCFLSENLGLARHAIQTLSKWFSLDIESLSWAQILSNTTLPCRFESVKHLSGANIVCDVAHNQLGFQTVISEYQRQFPDIRPIVILGLSTFRNPEQLLKLCKRIGSQLYYIKYDHPCMWSYADLLVYDSDIKPWGHSELFVQGQYYLCLGSFYLFETLFDR